MGAVIADIQLTDLKRISVEGGDVMHAMKQDDTGFAGFGEAYFSWINSKKQKGWKRHLKMTMNLIVSVGCVRFVFWDGYPGSFREEFIGPDSRYARLTVPPGIWFGFQGWSLAPSLILNLASIKHDPLEVERLALDEVNFNWN